MYSKCPKLPYTEDANKVEYANSADPDQSAPEGHLFAFPLSILRNQTLGKKWYGINITKTYLYNSDPLKPHFYIVKLGFTGVYIIFLISAQNIDCVYSLEPPRRDGSNEYHNLCFEQKYEKYQNCLSENFQFLVVTFSIYIGVFS